MHHSTQFRDPENPMAIQKSIGNLLVVHWPGGSDPRGLRSIIAFGVWACRQDRTPVRRHPENQIILT